MGIFSLDNRFFYILKTRLACFLFGGLVLYKKIKLHYLKS